MSYSSDEEFESDYDSIRDELDSVLSRLTANSQGSFAFERTHANAPNPILRVKGLGRVGLPLSDDGAQALIARCKPAVTPASLGRRANVRGAWEMEAAKVVVDNPEWQDFIHGAVTDVCDALGIREGRSRPRCELFKLVLHESGSHNLPHVNKEEAGNVFATVMIILPTEFTGGDVHVSHGSRSMVINTSKPSLTRTTVLALHTGVTYELQPITSGIRVALVYNLVHTTASPLPKLRDTSRAMERLRDVLRTWNSKPEGAPDKIVFCLDGEFPEKEKPTARALKGSDARTIALLDEAAKSVGLGMGLANIRHVLRRAAERSYNGGYDYTDNDVYDDSTIEELVDLEGWLLREKDLDFVENDNTIPSGFLEELAEEPEDYDNFDDDMDDDRGTLECIYIRPVLVIWPTWGDLAQLPGERRAQACLKRMSTFEGQKPTPEIEQAFTYVVQSTRKDSLDTLCDLARRWNRVDLWRSAILAFGHEKCADEIVAALERFGFEALESTIGEFVRALPPSNSAARASVLKSVRVWTRKNANPSVHAAVDPSYRK